MFVEFAIFASISLNSMNNFQLPVARSTPRTKTHRTWRHTKRGGWTGPRHWRIRRTRVGQARSAAARGARLPVHPPRLTNKSAPPNLTVDHFHPTNLTVENKYCLSRNLMIDKNCLPRNLTVNSCSPAIQGDSDLVLIMDSIYMLLQGCLKCSGHRILILSFHFVSCL